MFVLRELNTRGRSGYQLMNLYHEHTGLAKPSPGTMYPLLSGLESRGMVKMVVVGRSKIYHLTPKGQKIYQNMISEKKRFLKGMVRILSEVHGPSEIEAFKRTVLGGSAGTEIGLEAEAIQELREAVMRFMQSNKKPEKRAEFRKTILETADRIRRL